MQNNGSPTSLRLKTGLAEMLKGGVIMDVTNAEQATIAERAGTGDVVHAVKHIRQIVQEMKILTVLGEEELYAKAKEHQAPYELVKMVSKEGKLPVPNFSAGGIAHPLMRR